MRAMADSRLKVSYNLSTILSSKPPVNMDYEKALDATY